MVLANSDCSLLVHFVFASIFFVLVYFSHDHCGSVFMYEVGSRFGCSILENNVIIIILVFVLWVVCGAEVYCPWFF